MSKLISQVPDDILKPDLKKETTLDRIYAWYMEGDEGVELTPKEKQQRDRYKAAFALILENKLDHQIVEHLAGYFGISQRQAYRDLADTKKLYPDIAKTSKQTDRYILEQYLMQCYNLAKDTMDVKHMIKAAAEIGKIKGLQKDDPNLPNPEAYQQHNYIIQVNASVNNSQNITLEQVKALPPEELEKLLQTIQQTEISDLHLLKLLHDAQKSADEEPGI